MVNLNGNVFLFECFKPLFRDSGKVVCDFARADMAFLMNILATVDFLFFLKIHLLRVAVSNMVNPNGNVLF